MAGKALDREGNVAEIGFDLDIVASAGWEWEQDESPTGWNYKSDSPTYTTTTFASVNTPVVSSVSFSPEQDFTINGESHSIRNAQKYIDPTVLKQLLNPVLYAKLMGSAFEKEAENMEQPEPDFDEPDYSRDDY